MPYDLTSLFSSLGGGNMGGLLSGLGGLFGGGAQQAPMGQPPGTQNALPSTIFRPFPGSPVGPYAIPPGVGPPTASQLAAAPTNLPQSGAVQPPLQEGATPSLNQGGYVGSTRPLGGYAMPPPPPDASQLLAWVLSQGGGLDPATQETLQHAMMLHQLLLGGGGYG